LNPRAHPLILAKLDSSGLRSTFGLVVYEEHILQICEAFAGINPGQGDVKRGPAQSHI
jgi:DNA polymerase III alpha subunit